MFEDSSFDWHEMKAKLGERYFEHLQKTDPESIPLDEESLKEFKAKLTEKVYAEHYHPKTSEEYIEKFVENMQVCQLELEELKSPLSSEKLLDLHKKMQSGITKKDQYDCNRQAKFLFLPDGENNMVNTPDHVKKELALMDQQTQELWKNASTKEEKVRVSLFQGLRWVGIHPANDGNKRMMKQILNHSLSNLGMNPSLNKKWDDIAPEVFLQAMHGNNLSGFLKAVEQLYDVDLKVKEYEVPPFKMMPERDQSKKLTLENSRIHDGNGFSNTTDFCRYDDELLKNAKKEVSPLKFRAKMVLSKLKLQLNSEEALTEVNKLEGAVSEKTLSNLRYLCAVSESGFKKYTDNAIQQGILDDTIKNQKRRPIVVKSSSKTEPSKDLAAIFKDAEKALDKTQPVSLNSTVRVGTVQMQTVQMNEKTHPKLQLESTSGRMKL